MVKESYEVLAHKYSFTFARIGANSTFGVIMNDGYSQSTAEGVVRLLMKRNPYHEARE